MGIYHQKTIIFGALAMMADSYSGSMTDLINTVFGLSQGITQKVWQDFGLCRQGTATQIKTDAKIS